MRPRTEKPVRVGRCDSSRRGVLFTRASISSGSTSRPRPTKRRRRLKPRPCPIFPLREQKRGACLLLSGSLKVRPLFHSDEGRTTEKRIDPEKNGGSLYRHPFPTTREGKGRKGASSFPRYTRRARRSLGKCGSTLTKSRDPERGVAWAIKVEGGEAQRRLLCHVDQGLRAAVPTCGSTIGARRQGKRNHREYGEERVI